MKRQLCGAGLTLLLMSCTPGNIFKPSGKNAGKVEETNKTGDQKKEVVEEEEIVERPLIEQAITDEEIVHFAELKEAEDQMTLLCSRFDPQVKTNVVIQKFCVEKVRPQNIVELQQALGVVIPPNMQQGDIGQGGVPGFAMQGHSSSLVGQFVSAINPRVILFNSQTPGTDARSAQDFVAMGFVRGEQFAEVIVVNLDAQGQPIMLPDSTGALTIKDVSLFLVAFKQACNARPEGCNAGELLTPAVESNWTEFTVYQDEDLKNTIVDCRHCHQPEGLGTQKFGRMQELRNPWVHWMRDNRDNGTTLQDDYFAAHGTAEDYGGVPASSIAASDPNELERLIDANSFEIAQIEEIEFDTGGILQETIDTSAAQPADNTVPGVSPIWEDLYALAKTGVSSDGRNIIPIPYHDVKVTEPELLQKYTAQYQSFVAGNLPLEQFEDHREIFRVDQRQRADMGFAVRAEEDARTTLSQACFQCHNGKLDTSITRSRFDINIDNMVAREDVDAGPEIDLAIQRLKLGYSKERLKAEGIQFYNEAGEVVELHKGEHMLTMPPRRFKSLTDTQIDSLIQFLESEKARIGAAATALKK